MQSRDLIDPWGNHLDDSNLIGEARAKKDLASRLKKLASEIVHVSDKAWLLRRARHIEQDAERLERETTAQSDS